MSLAGPQRLVNVRTMRTLPFRRSVGLIAVAMALPHPVLAADGATCTMEPIARLPVIIGRDGPRTQATINGKPITVLLASGSFFNLLPRNMALDLRLPLNPLPHGDTVSGMGRTSRPDFAVAKDFSFAGGNVRRMEFVVGGTDKGSASIGANLLGAVDAEFDFAKGAVNLFEESGCAHSNLAYWSQGMALFEARKLESTTTENRQIFIEVAVNGRPLRALLDTTSSTSALGRQAAERAGMDLSGAAGPTATALTSQGVRPRTSRVARMAAFSIGGESIQNSPIWVVDTEPGDWLGADMLLGVDFLMAHHVLVSPRQNKVFLTYNGGPIFAASTTPAAGQIAIRTVGMGNPEAQVDPATADEFAGRGSARLTRRDFTGAIADLSQAIKLAPARTDLLTERARAYEATGNADLAKGDIAAALALAPTDSALLTMRGRSRLKDGDKAGAAADAQAALASAKEGSLDTVWLGVLLENLGQADRALVLIEPVIALHREDTSYPMLINTRSWYRALTNVDLDPALADANDAVRQSGGRPSHLDTRAWIQYRKGNYAATIADAGAALDKEPKLATSLFIRALARAARGDEAGARADLAAARALQPTIDLAYAAYGLGTPAALAPPPVRSN